MAFFGNLRVYGMKMSCEIVAAIIEQHDGKILLAQHPLA